MQRVARLLMISVLIAAPWCLAGAPLVFQPWLFGGILLSALMGLIGELFAPDFREAHGTVIAFPLLATAVVGLAGIQLVPTWNSPTLSHAILATTLQFPEDAAQALGPASIYPAETRLFMARIALATSGFLGGAWLFSSNRSRQWLWSILAINGVILVIFGLIQKATWNERIFWTLPLLYGGQPFASFINRNNAAGYLAMCLAAAIGLMLRCRIVTSGDQGEVRTSSLKWSRIPKVHLGQQSLLIIIVVLIAGILATMSRGGIISMAMAILATLFWLGGFRRWRFLVIPLSCAIVLSLGLITWIGFDRQLQFRMASLEHSFTNDGRIFHWSDMLNAIRDFPLLGTGFGTYRYANKPYQNHFSDGWYVNADNEYLEWLVEAGAPGLTIAIGGLVVLGILSVKWWRMGYLPETLVCGFLLVTQGLQSLTDFGIVVTANLLTIAVLLGSLSAADIRDRASPLTTIERVQRLLNQQGRLSRTIGVVTILSLLAGLGLFELTTAAAAVRFRDQLPFKLEKREQLTLGQTDAALSRGNWILSLRPDDAELHATMANLWYHRYRLEMFEILSSRASSPQDLDFWWNRTASEVLAGEVCRLRAIGAADTLSELNRDPIAVINLEQVRRHLSLAYRSCRWLPKIGVLKATTAILNGDDGRDDLRREATLSPSDPITLRHVGFYANLLGDKELDMICLQRQMQFNPDRSEELLRQAMSRLETSEIIANVLPQNPESLVRIAEAWKAPSGRIAAIAKANLNLHRTRPSIGKLPYLKARLAILDAKPAIAREHFVQAIQENPLEVTWRRGFAEFLASQGETEAAIEQAKLCEALSPDDASIKELLRHLKLGLDRQ